MNIVLKPILASYPEPLLIHRKIAKDTTSFTFYINNIFKAFKTYEK